MTETTSAAELPEALQIAGTLEKSVIAFGQTRRGAQARAAAELRCLHARVQELEAQIAKKRVPDQAPFGYFRAEPFGWTDCAETDEGAIALYDRPAPPAVVEPLTDAQIAVLWAEKPRYHAAPIGFTDIEFARAIEAAHGIGIKKGDSHGIPT